MRTVTASIAASQLLHPLALLEHVLLEMAMTNKCFYLAIYQIPIFFKTPLVPKLQDLSCEKEA